jgi:hypothetical protein
MRLFGYEIRKVNKEGDVNGIPNKATCLHPTYKTVTEFAFEIDGKEYYQFKNLLDMPVLRYKRTMEFIREAELSISSKDLEELIRESIEQLNKGDLTKSIIIQNAILNLSSQFMETDTYYRLFSCVFFDLDENILDYDYDYNEEKISLFKKQPATAFFFNQPMRKYLIQPNISEEDLETFLKLTKAQKEYVQKIKQGYTIKK